jgi:hypothetical protein
MIALVLAALLATQQVGLPEAQTSSVACVGECAAYRAEMFQWRRITKELVGENTALEIELMLAKQTLQKCMERPEPVCPDTLPWFVGGIGGGIVIGVLGTGGVCSALSGSGP